MKKALLIIDIQNDFCPVGNLPVAGGDSIIPFINELIEKPDYDLIILTKDWHPSNHKSFASQHKDKNSFDVINLFGVEQVLWPDHCVQNTFGAEFHKSLKTNVDNQFVFTKGMNENIDSYSGFFDNKHNSSTGLNEFLKERNIEIIDVAGLALDYCVKFTALDGIKLGYEVNVILNGCKAISEDISRHIEEMKINKINII
jgi:nicotinamidase/pyrazinamidase